jgi:MFS family permease
VLCAGAAAGRAAPSIGVLLAASCWDRPCGHDGAGHRARRRHAGAPKRSRGKLVGTVMTGLLLGILLSRVVSGFVAEHFGWRAMFIAAAASIALIGAAAWRGLPRFRADHAPGLRRAARLAGHAVVAPPRAAPRRLAQALLAVGFSAFWSTLAVMLHGAPFHLGSAAAGAFGLAGAAGALAAPWPAAWPTAAARCW